MKKILISLLCVFLYLSPIYADPFEPNASYSVCFTPDMNCTQKVVDAINAAVSDIWVQAYSFTSHPIGQALVTAQQRGVKVQIIFDKSALSENQSTLRYFSHNKIPMWIDSQPAIAHNKVMVLDQTRVITGSFNFTRSAQERNAENLLLIDDGHLAQQYLQNWLKRQKVSETYQSNASVAENNWLTDLLNAIWNWLRSWF